MAFNYAVSLTPVFFLLFLTFGIAAENQCKFNCTSTPPTSYSNISYSVNYCQPYPFGDDPNSYMHFVDKPDSLDVRFVDTYQCNMKHFLGLVISWSVPIAGMEFLKGFQIRVTPTSPDEITNRPIMCRDMLFSDNTVLTIRDMYTTFSLDCLNRVTPGNEYYIEVQSLPKPMPGLQKDNTVFMKYQAPDCSSVPMVVDCPDGASGVILSDWLPPLMPQVVVSSRTVLVNFALAPEKYNVNEYTVNLFSKKLNKSVLQEIVSVAEGDKKGTAQFENVDIGEYEVRVFPCRDCIGAQSEIFDVEEWKAQYIHGNVQGKSRTVEVYFDMADGTYGSIVYNYTVQLVSNDYKKMDPLSQVVQKPPATFHNIPPGFYTAKVAKYNCTQCEWATSSPLEVDVNCLALSDLPNGSKNCTINGIETTNTTFNTECRFSCHQGYESAGSTQRTCRANKYSTTWSGTDFTCTAVKCPVLNNPPNGNITCNKNGMNAMSTPIYNTVCTYKCHDGFVPGDRSDRTCLANRTWSGRNFSCIAIYIPQQESQQREIGKVAAGVIAGVLGGIVLVGIWYLIKKKNHCISDKMSQSSEDTDPMIEDTEGEDVTSEVQPFNRHVTQVDRLAPETFPYQPPAENEPSVTNSQYFREVNRQVHDVLPLSQENRYTTTMVDTPEEVMQPQYEDTQLWEKDPYFEQLRGHAGDWRTAEYLEPCPNETLLYDEPDCYRYSIEGQNTDLQPDQFAVLHRDTHCLPDGNSARCKNEGEDELEVGDRVDSGYYEHCQIQVEADVHKSDDTGSYMI